MYEHLGSLRPQYTNILIDEAQTLELELMTLRKLVKNGPNDVFLACDIAQTILPKKNDTTKQGSLLMTECSNFKKTTVIPEKSSLARETLSSIDDAYDENSIEYLEPDFATEQVICHS